MAVARRRLADRPAARMAMARPLADLESAALGEAGPMVAGRADSEEERAVAWEEDWGVASVAGWAVASVADWAAASAEGWAAV